MRPDFLNVLVAFFVLEWRSVSPLTVPHHGIDQTGAARVIPNYVRSWGVDACVYYLLRCPPRRSEDDPGYLNGWLEEISRNP